jgi:hypothetical protein
VAGKRPDAEIMALIERIARFMETLDSHFLNDAFADGKVVLPTFSRVVMQLRAGRIETGGWAFVLMKAARGWRVRNYGWAVTGIAMEGPLIDPS